MENEKLEELFLYSLVKSYENPFNESLNEISSKLMDIMHDLQMYDEVSLLLDKAKELIK